MLVGRFRRGDGKGGWVPVKIDLKVDVCFGELVDVLALMFAFCSGAYILIVKEVLLVVECGLTLCIQGCGS